MAVQAQYPTNAFSPDFRNREAGTPNLERRRRVQRSAERVHVQCIRVQEACAGRFHGASHPPQPGPLAAHPYPRRPPAEPVARVRCNFHQRSTCSVVASRVSRSRSRLPSPPTEPGNRRPRPRAEREVADWIGGGAQEALPGATLDVGAAGGEAPDGEGSRAGDGEPAERGVGRARAAAERREPDVVHHGQEQRSHRVRPADEPGAGPTPGRLRCRRPRTVRRRRRRRGGVPGRRRAVVLLRGARAAQGLQGVRGTGRVRSAAPLQARLRMQGLRVEDRHVSRLRLHQERVPPSLHVLMKAARSGFVVPCLGFRRPAGRVEWRGIC
uniref:Uncharacterized protein n=1 Tax=Musa acuminata subsp. malaccensis TaxID=214687 RepID=A0A804JFT1_MUSAM|nr:PREDICTED: serine/arginine repetitive matrix protein 2 isoform X1 [Musa acuminata subsp. malaccensis]